MLVLSALCVLLPLAASLDTCDESKSKAYLAKTQLEGNLLDNFGDKKFWFVASGSDGSDSRVNSVEIQFDSVKDNSVVANFVFRDSNGTTSQSTSSTYNLEGDHILALRNSVALYFFKCSNNLIASYRCAVENAKVSGPMYYIWAAWDKSDADVSGEISACEAAITKEDAAATSTACTLEYRIMLYITSAVFL